MTNKSPLKPQPYDGGCVCMHNARDHIHSPDEYVNCRNCSCGEYNPRDKVIAKEYAATYSARHVNEQSQDPIYKAISDTNRAFTTTCSVDGCEWTHDSTNSFTSETEIAVASHMLEHTPRELFETINKLSNQVSELFTNADAMAEEHCDGHCNHGWIKNSKHLGAR